jgi:hypothetical protein
MNFKQAKSLAMTLYYASAAKHDIDDHQLSVMINSMNKKYWREAARGMGSLLAKDSPDTTTTSQQMGAFTTQGITYSGTTLDPAGVYQILAAEIKYLGRYIHLEYEILQDRYLYNIAFGQVQALIPSAFCIRGESLLLLPAIMAPQQMRITYIPKPVDLALDSDNLLSGLLTDFHENIVYEAVAMLLPKDADRPVVGVAKEMKDQFQEYMQSRQRQEGRKIRYVPWD